MYQAKNFQGASESKNTQPLASLIEGNKFFLSANRLHKEKDPRSTLAFKEASKRLEEVLDGPHCGFNEMEILKNLYECYQHLWAVASIPLEYRGQSYQELGYERTYWRKLLETCKKIEDTSTKIN